MIAAFNARGFWLLVAGLVVTAGLVVLWSLLQEDDGEDDDGDDESNDGDGVGVHDADSTHMRGR